MRGGKESEVYSLLRRVAFIPAIIRASKSSLLEMQSKIIDENKRK